MEKLLNKISSLKHLNGEEWSKLENSLNMIQNNFTYMLRKKYYMLSDDDIHIILLMRINMKNTMISHLLHIQPTSFRIRRCRLKKKMGIECDSLNEFIINLFK